MLLSCSIGSEVLWVWVKVKIDQSTITAPKSTTQKIERRARFISLRTLWGFYGTFLPLFGATSLSAHAYWVKRCQPHRSGMMVPNACPSLTGLERHLSPYPSKCLETWCHTVYLFVFIELCVHICIYMYDIYI